MSLFEELRRRKVFRVLGIYAVTGWLLMQLANHFEEALNLPGWFDTIVTLTVIIGFPLALVLAWIFELTPEGLKKTEDLSDGANPSSDERSKPHVLLLGVVVVLVGLAAWQLTKLTTENRETPAEQVVSDKSIAVLPFIALSDDRSDAYFGKGLAEELLNALAQFPNLKVAARTSAFSFDGDDVDLRDVGRQLGVAYVLEGSVRSAGDQVRVTAQLIRAEDGFHAWSETYDRNLSDLLEVQDEIVAAISRTLQIHLGVGVGRTRASGHQVDPEAYRNYLLGLEFWGLRSDPQKRRQAIRTFQLVTDQDPDFADGWAAFGTALVYSVPRVSGMPLELHYQTALGAFERALELEPDNARALSGLAVNLLSFDLDIVRAHELAERAVAIAPNASQSHYAYAWTAELQGDLVEANQAYERAIALDPLNTVLKRVRALHYHALIGDVASITEAMEDCLDCSDDDTLVYNMAKYMASRRGGTDDEVRESAAAFREIVIKISQQSGPLLTDLDVDFFMGVTDPAFVEWLLGGDRPDEDRLAWMDTPNCTACNLTFAPALASVGDFDAALTMMEQTSREFGEALFYIINPFGRDAWPDELRRDPRFHQFWQRKGMPELAAILRSKGITEGLPIPPES